MQVHVEPKTAAAEHLARRARLGCLTPRSLVVSAVLVRAREQGSRTIYSEPAGPPDLKGIAARAGLVNMALPYLAAFQAGTTDEPKKIRYFASEIIAAVCRVRGVGEFDVLSSRRTAEVVKVRHEACWLIKNLTTLSLPQIGRAMDHRDHTTILHGVRKHQAKIDAGLVDTLGDIKPAIDAARAAKIETEARP